MALTRDFKETVQARAQRDPAFREGLLKEGSSACWPVMSIRARSCCVTT